MHRLTMSSPTSALRLREQGQLRLLPLYQAIVLALSVAMCQMSRL